MSFFLSYITLLCSFFYTSTRFLFIIGKIAFIRKAYTGRRLHDHAELKRFPTGYNAKRRPRIFGPFNTLILQFFFSAMTAMLVVC